MFITSMQLLCVCKPEPRYISSCCSRKIVKVDWLMQKLLDTSNVYNSSLALMRDSFMRGICAWMSEMRRAHFEYSIISPVKELAFEGLSYSSSGILISSSSDFILSFAYGNIISYMMYPICLRRRWEDSLNNGSAPRSAPRPNISNTASNPSRRGGRGRGVQNAGRAGDVTFVSATGEPISGRRCFVCGDPSHFANACPSRGSWCLALSKKSWNMLKYVEDRFGPCSTFSALECRNFVKLCSRYDRTVFIDFVLHHCGLKSQEQVYGLSWIGPP